MKKCILSICVGSSIVLGGCAAGYNIGTGIGSRVMNHTVAAISNSVINDHGAKHPDFGNVRHNFLTHPIKRPSQSTPHDTESQIVQTIQPIEQPVYETHVSDVSKVQKEKVRTDYIADSVLLDSNSKTVLDNAVGTFENICVGTECHDGSLLALLASSYRDYVFADVAILDPTLIQGQLNAGPVSVGDILRVTQSSGVLYTVDMTGAELKTYLTKLSKLPKDIVPYINGDNVSVSMKTVRTDISKMKFGGLALRDDVIYRVVMPYDTARGVDDYPVVTHYPTSHYTGTLAGTALRVYLKQQHKLENLDASHYVFA